MMRKWQVWDLGYGETETGKAAAVSQLLASTASSAAMIGGIIAILNGVTSITWILGMMTSGTFPAVVAEIVDRALYQ